MCGIQNGDLQALYICLFQINHNKPVVWLCQIAKIRKYQQKNNSNRE